MILRTSFAGRLSLHPSCMPIPLNSHSTINPAWPMLKWTDGSQTWGSALSTYSHITTPWPPVFGTGSMTQFGVEKKRLILLYLCSLCGTEKQLVKHLFLWASLFQNLLQMTLMGSPCLHCHTIHIHSRLGSKYSIEYIFIHTLTTKYLNNWIDSRHNTWAYFHARYKSLGIRSGPKILSVLVNWSLWST